MKKFISAALALIMTLCFALSMAGCNNRDKKMLWELYEDYFDIGAAMADSMINIYSDSIAKQFNSFTAENEMKWQETQSTRGNFNYTKGDRLVAFAKENNAKVRGHALVWHQSAPSWIFETSTGQQASKADVLYDIRNHITNVMQHFGDDVYCWDVVNEAISDSTSEKYRPSPFYNIVGEEYIFEAFKIAREVSPNTLLFYNDYNMDQPIKRAKVIEMIKEMQQKGIPIDGVGMQGHYKSRRFEIEEFEKAIEEFSALGLKIHITELDFSIYMPGETNESYDFLSDEMAALQADAYAKCFEIMRKHKDSIFSVTMWGLADDHTWLDNYPVAGRKDYPLLFDIGLDPKPAYFAIRNFD